MLTSFGRGNANAGGIGFSLDGRFVIAATGGPALRVFGLLTNAESGQLRAPARRWRWRG